jgi:dienelactone hydrolase
MHFLPRGRRTAGLVAGLALLLLAPAGHAQDKDKGQNVKFDSYDGVELHGSFYASGGRAPCVLMVHKIGENRDKEDWKALAKSLQEKGFTVLAFDLRGHGDSTDVGPSFWHGPNMTIKGASPTKRKISYKDFPPNYLPYLVNDIAAAKRYLDKQSEAKACNSSNVIVIGAQDGATLGALWIASEWHRSKLTRNAFGGVVNAGKPEGEDIACGVWLSMTGHLGNRSLSLANWYTQPLGQAAPAGIREKVPMYLLYGEGDTAAKNFALSTIKSLKQGQKGSKTVDLTGPKAVSGTKLAGRELLKKSLGTDELIGKYIDQVMEKRGFNPPESRDLKAPLHPVNLTRFGLGG